MNVSFLQPAFGLLVMVALAWAFSESKRQLDWKIVVTGLVLQILIAYLMLNITLIQDGLAYLNQGVNAIVKAVEAGTGFVFGYLGTGPENTTYPFTIAIDSSGATFIVAFRVLPLILFFTVFSALLWHFRILPWIVHGFSLALRRTMGIGGAVGVSTAANIFIGMVESPLLIRPYLSRLSRSELFMVMSCGMATVAGTVMVLYAVILQDIIDNPLGHILTASVISAPAALMVARIMVPGQEVTEEGGELASGSQYQSVMDAITLGTADGTRLMVNVGAMLIVLISLVALVNAVLSLFPAINGADLKLETLMGYLFAPVVWLMGIPWRECFTAGSLMGSKTVLNELLAFIQLANLPAGELSQHSRVIMTYGICGFANFGSLGIMLGGLGAMCPERRQEITALAPKTLISGTIATCMTGAVAGMLL